MPCLPEAMRAASGGRGWPKVPSAKPMEWPDEGAIASLVETCKLNGVNPQTYLADLLERLVNGWPQARIDELMPWCWAQEAT